MNSKQQGNIRELSKKTRFWRKIHNYFGLLLALFILVSAATGILLSLKKQVPLIQPTEQPSAKANIEEWLPLDALVLAADSAMKAWHPQNTPILDRMDVRPKKGLVKMLYQPGHWEVQMEGSTGRVLSVEKRYSDLIEQIHDGTIVSDLFGLITMNFLGIGMIVLMATGLWIWYSPKLIRHLKRS